MSQKNLSGLHKRAVFEIALVSVVLVAAIYYVYFVPRVKYAGKALTKEVLDSIPVKGQNWQEAKVQDVNTNLEGEVYNFISRIFARQYENLAEPGQVAFLIVLDAGNFHYPKVCFTGAGFKSEELEARVLNLKSGQLKVHLMLSESKSEGLLSVYWICIDKQIIPTWAEQKAKQLYYSLFNKERVGLMARIDVPVLESVDVSLKIAENFINDISEAMPEKYRGYLVGS